MTFCSNLCSDDSGDDGSGHQSRGGTSDPLHASTALPFDHMLFPFGFTTKIKSNEPAVIRAAEESWAKFPPRFHEAPIELRFLVSDLPTKQLPGSPTFRAQSNLLTIVADAHNFACCDLAAGFGFACVTKTTALTTDYLRYHFLDAMLYTLLDARHLVAVHAACLAKNGSGVLFAGDSGAGKSSLAYACARRGWTYVSDDATWLVRRETGLLVVGNPETFRFRPTISVLFPELQGPIRVRNGKPTLEIKAEYLSGITASIECTIDYVVFLNRQEEAIDQANLSPMSREESLRRLLEQNAWPSELRIQGERQRAIERFEKAQLFELTYSELNPAIDLLEQVLRRGKQ